MSKYCSGENYLSLDDFELIAKFMACTGSGIFLLRLGYERVGSVLFYRLYLSFCWRRERAVYLGCTRKLKKIPSSYWLKRLIKKVENEKNTTI